MKKFIFFEFDPFVPDPEVPDPEVPKAQNILLYKSEGLPPP
jgi:hypothetical protein